ncbi:MAG: cytochrome b/b6 domain-containing protein [Acidobacteriota bacterium]
MEERILIRDDEEFERMSLNERIQHVLLIISFFVLIITGFPILFYEFKAFKWLFFFQGSFALRGILHRIAAVLLIVLSVYHVFYVIFSDRGRNNVKQLMPKWKDVQDAFGIFMHNLGFTRFLYKRDILKNFFNRNPSWLFLEPPKFERYNFIEKFEYLAVVWGSFVMIISGFFLWFEEVSIALFPKWVYDVFKIIHGYEALLAFLAVIVWHMYNVHLNPENFPMSKIWITGKITGKELRLQHPLEYERILNERKKRGQPPLRSEDG